ncbi:MAG: hypothetical protein KGJ13_08440, partial [Patescibacteria group bacterium]|nr:hypothetical protein [Patescibacteria group bacterium]
MDVDAIQAIIRDDGLPEYKQDGAWAEAHGSRLATTEQAGYERGVRDAEELLQSLHDKILSDGINIHDDMNDETRERFAKMSRIEIILTAFRMSMELFYADALKAIRALPATKPEGETNA